MCSSHMVMTFPRSSTSQLTMFLVAVFDVIFIVLDFVESVKASSGPLRQLPSAVSSFLLWCTLHVDPPKATSSVGFKVRLPEH